MKTVAQTVIEADRFYTIAAHTGNVIQAVEASKDGGTVRLGKYDHKPEQEWSFVRVGEGVYRIRNRASGKLLDLTMTGTANGTWLHLWEDVGGTSQMWELCPTPEGTVRLRSSWAGGKCVDTVGMGAEAGAVLQIWQEVPGADQLWTIAEVKDRAKRTAKKTAEPAVEAAPAAEAVAPAEEKKAPQKACRPQASHHQKGRCGTGCDRPARCRKGRRAEDGARRKGGSSREARQGSRQDHCPEEGCTQGRSRRPGRKAQAHP